ncbi:MAG: metal ABC transporter ATP-binding protein [Flavobacteriales bacterium]|nr:metal ABC transporter ATP-binding protein [Bacteroidota bacterium]MCB9241020.1 metal ABC transporter ATP-binding protein [Flavobacteriales bacterium]
MTGNSVETHNLTVIYNKKPAIWNIDFTLPAGKIIGVMGPNGSGKSTLLKAIMGIIEPNIGYAKIFDKDLDDVRERVSYVPQRQSVDWDFPASVWDVVAMGRYARKGMLKRLSAEDKSIIEESLEKVNMTAFAQRQISQLSGGQQQRVFLARALAQQADIYFMDEPFVGVDAATEEAIINLLKSMRDQGKTLIVVHHDLHTAQDYFEWMVLLNTRLVRVGPVEDVFNQETLTETYGGTLTTLSKVASLLQEKSFPMRHK